VNWLRHPRIIQLARNLRCGGVIAYPTEAVWGLGCDPADRAAVYELLALKSRPLEKGLILIAGNVEQLEPYLGNLSPEQRVKLSTPTERPVTWIVPAAYGAPYWVTGGRRTIAVRVTRHPLVVALCAAFGGALVSTSANPGGLPPARTRLKVRQYFHGRLAGIAPGNVGAAGKPSEIRDIESGAVLRDGG
jgi:L-threonylcarbamoyladenylate synthase